MGAVTDPDLAAGQLLSGKFRVERVLGRGGMGAVYVAEHIYTKRRGALKLLHKTYAAVPEVVERFIREASAAGVIGNPHVVETIDAGLLDTGEPYMFMELLDGMSLDELLEKRSRLRFDEAADLIAQAAEGLAAAHASGVVHRDIKPGNLFLVGGEQPFVKLLDFGISKFAPAYREDQSLTVEGRLLGTPLYMSPEQVNGQRDLDARADIYALGVVLYEMLAGQPPFTGETLMELSVRIHDGKYVPVSQIRADAPDGFDEMLGKAMAVDRQTRYATAEEFRSSLVQLVGARADSFAPTMAGQSDAPRASGVSEPSAAVSYTSVAPTELGTASSASPPPPPRSLSLPGAQVTLDPTSAASPSPSPSASPVSSAVSLGGSSPAPGMVRDEAPAGVAKARSPRALVVALSVALAVAVAAWFVRRDTDEQSESFAAETAPTDAVPSQPVAVAPVPSSTPKVVAAHDVVKPATASVVTAAAAMSSEVTRAKAAPRKQVNTPSVAVAAPPPSPEPTSAAGRDGLTESNPFAQ